MHKKLNWQAYSKDERNKIIDEVKEIISQSDGYILNFNMFSDLALSLGIEIKENGIHELYNALSCVLKVSNFDLEAINRTSSKEWLILLNISFQGGKGELKREIPAIPG